MLTEACSNVNVSLRQYSLSQAITLYIESLRGVVSPSTVTWYTRRLPSLLEYLGDIDIASITITDLRQWRGHLANRKTRYDNHPSRPAMDGGLSPHTIHQYVRACRALFKWLCKEEILEVNPAKRLELPILPTERRRGVPLQSRNQIIAAASCNTRDYAILMFLADTACRVGGVSWLRLTDLELDHRRALVHEKGRGGRGKTRYVFFTATTATAISNYLSERPVIPECPYVFLGIFRGHWGRLQEGGIYQMIGRYADKLQIPPGWNPHNWRHRQIRTLIRLMSLPEASQIAGHSSVKVTGDIYGTFDDEELQERFDACYSSLS